MQGYKHYLELFCATIPSDCPTR